MFRSFREVVFGHVLTRHAGLPPGAWFGGCGWTLVSDITIPICADEEAERLVADGTCRSPADALRIVGDGLAQVITIKLAKCGVVHALEIAAIARAGGVGLMMGGMVETRLAMGFGAHFAAGLGGFDWIDLDMPLPLAKDPVVGGAVCMGRTTVSTPALRATAPASPSDPAHIRFACGDRDRRPVLPLFLSQQQRHNLSA